MKILRGILFLVHHTVRWTIIGIFIVLIAAFAIMALGNRFDVVVPTQLTILYQEIVIFITSIGVFLLELISTTHALILVPIMVAGIIGMWIASDEIESAVTFFWSTITNGITVFIEIISGWILASWAIVVMFALESDALPFIMGAYGLIPKVKELFSVNTFGMWEYFTFFGLCIATLLVIRKFWIWYEDRDISVTTQAELG